MAMLGSSRWGAVRSRRIGYSSSFFSVGFMHRAPRPAKRTSQHAASAIKGRLLITKNPTLRDTHLPPIAALRAAGVPMAVSTDHNPGTSAALSLLLMANMACTLFRLTVPEALAGITLHAARALGLQDTHGALEVGRPANCRKTFPDAGWLP